MMGEKEREGKDKGEDKVRRKEGRKGGWRKTLKPGAGGEEGKRE